MWSFRFLNPRMVDKMPYKICYHGIEPGDPDVPCSEIPPNKLRFLGWWFLSPERHCLEWIGFVVFGILVLGFLLPLKLKKASRDDTNKHECLLPMTIMKLATIMFYPYVSYTKMSWPGSNYSGRWLLFVGMPVGTLWILSALFCFGPWSRTATNRSASKDYYTIRYWILEIWLSFLPTVGVWGLIPGLFVSAIQEFRWDALLAVTGATDGQNATLSYFCHALLIVVTPCWYVLSGELTMLPKSSDSGDNRNGITPMTFLAMAIDCGQRQLVGTAICALYYMGIVTPAAIVWGINVNFLLDGGWMGPNFRIHAVVGWFFWGWATRLALGVTEILRDMCIGGSGDKNRKKI